MPMTEQELTEAFASALGLIWEGTSPTAERVLAHARSMHAAGFRVLRERDEARAEVERLTRQFETMTTAQCAVARSERDEAIVELQQLHARLHKLAACIRALPFTPDTKNGARQAWMRERAACLVDGADPGSPPPRECINCGGSRTNSTCPLCVCQPARAPEGPR